MVGHFLQTNRKPRSNHSAGSTPPHHISSNRSNSVTGSTNPMSPSRYASSASSYDVPSMPYMPPQNLTAEAVAALPPPGLSGPSGLVFGPKRTSCGGKSRYLAYISTSSKPPSSISNRRLRTNVDPAVAAAAATSSERHLCILDLETFQQRPLLKLPSKRQFDVNERQQSASATSSTDMLSLEERLRRERQRLHSSGGLTQFCWAYNRQNTLRILVPIRGSLYVQDGLDSFLKLVYDKHSLDDAVRSSNLKPPPSPSAIDPQLSPDGELYAFCALGEVYVASAHECRPPVQITFGADLRNSITHGLADFVAQEEMDRYRGFWWSPDSKGIVFAKVDESSVPPYRITHHEHETTSEKCMYEDHRYPFAGKSNPSVKLAFVRVDAAFLERRNQSNATTSAGCSVAYARAPTDDPQLVAQQNWEGVIWFDPPREASEYLARLSFLPDGSACAQWQNRTQNCLVLTRMDLRSGTARTLLVERSDVWINLHHLIHALARPIHPTECQNVNIQPPVPYPLPEGSFSFLFGSERTGFCHLYLYTYVPNLNGEQAMLMRQVSAGEWMVESIVGVSLEHNAVYVTGTVDSVLERHLYALPIVVPTEDEMHANISAMDCSSPTSPVSNHPNGVRRGLKHVMNALAGKSSSSANYNDDNRIMFQNAATPSSSSNGGINESIERWSGEVSQSYSSGPIRLTSDSGMHCIVMDADCTRFVDTSSDLGRPTSVKIFEIPNGGPFATFSDKNRLQSGREDATMTPPTARLLDIPVLFTLYDAVRDDKSMDLSPDLMSHLPAPEMMTFPSSDGIETLHAALYRPDAQIHGPGPYPLICAVYGGPHVQRVNRSWSQCADMRAQRLRSLGFCVVKCDNRGSSRRGLAFESAISRRLGRLEVLDQVAVVRQLTVRGIADPTRVGIYGWSYGGYLSAMCLCRAPDVFHVAVAGAPVTSWDGYDTHYTERYMGLPSDNPSGYRESAVFDHVPNMRGKLLLVHGLIDENVHFRHTARLINRLIAAGKDYDLLLFPDERHSPRRLRDRIYMEQRISDYFLKHLSNSSFGGTIRTMAGL
eukprot:scaffold2381_cov128-Cylindrotheca_fusiformis.AAC.5